MIQDITKNIMIKIKKKKYIIIYFIKNINYNNKI